MLRSSSIWLTSLLLFAGVLPLPAAELQNAGFEKLGGWQVVTRGAGLMAAFDARTSQAGKKSFTISIDSRSPTEKEEFAGIAQVVELTRADEGISFYVKETYTGGTARSHWMELLLDGEILRDRADMIDIFTIAKTSKYHSKPPPGNRFTMAEIFHSVAVRDRDNTWR